MIIPFFVFAHASLLFSFVGVCFKPPETANHPDWGVSAFLQIHVVVEVVTTQQDGLRLLVRGDPPRRAEGIEVAFEVIQGALSAVPFGAFFGYSKQPSRWMLMISSWGLLAEGFWQNFWMPLQKVGSKHMEKKFENGSENREAEQPNYHTLQVLLFLQQSKSAHFPSSWNHKAICFCLLQPIYNLILSYLYLYHECPQVNLPKLVMKNQVAGWCQCTPCSRS